MINRVILVGRLTRDIEVRKTTSGLSVAQFTVACDRRGARQENGQSQADFINCVAWRQAADFLGTYAKKGNLVGVEGRIQTRNYEGQDGKRVYVTEVVCDSVQLLESRRVREGGERVAAPIPEPEAPAYSGGFTQPSTPSSTSSITSEDDFNSGDPLVISSDDLPF